MKATVKFHRVISSIILNIYLLFQSLLAVGQTTTTSASDGSPDKSYLFRYDIKLEACDPDGTIQDETELVPQGTQFNITSKNAIGYVITINLFHVRRKMSEPEKAAQRHWQQILNFITPDSAERSFLPGNVDNRKHFLLKFADYSSFAVQTAEKFPIDFGTLIEPFKFRSHPSIFTTNLSLGAIIGFQKNFPKSNFSWGLYAGISLSSITLDSFSTRGIVKINSDRPALTPSANVLLGYKSINITVGIGWDIINRTSSVEGSWVYQGKPWIGLGIGLKLFTTTNSSTVPTSQPAPQTKSPL